MKLAISVDQLVKQGLEQKTALKLLEDLTKKIQHIDNPTEAWPLISAQLTAQRIPFLIHETLFKGLFPQWPDHPDAAPAWLPTADNIKNANISRFMSALHFAMVEKFHQWTVTNYADFWQRIVTTLNIKFIKTA